jgi:hypothetical protein
MLARCGAHGVTRPTCHVSELPCPHTRAIMLQRCLVSRQNWGRIEGVRGAVIRKRGQLMKMSCSQHASAGGCSAGAPVPLSAVRVLIPLPLSSRAGPARPPSLKPGRTSSGPQDAPRFLTRGKLILAAEAMGCEHENQGDLRAGRRRLYCGPLPRTQERNWAS